MHAIIECGFAKRAAPVAVMEWRFAVASQGTRRVQACDLVQNVVSRLEGVHASNGSFEARCPAHDDRHASLSVSRGDDGRVLLHCHAGCTPEQVCVAIGLGLQDLFPANGKRQNLGRIIATYDYRDADGALLFQVVRFEPKNFRQRRPAGNGGWTWNLKGTPRVLYRLAELRSAPAEAWVFGVEGEKDADRLAAAGLIATTNPLGAGKWRKLSDDSALEGRRVCVIADKDKAGRDHAADVAKRLFGRVTDLRVVELPGDGKDASDWLAAGGTADELIQIVEAAPAYAPPPKTEGSSASGTATSNDGRPQILIDTEEHRVGEMTIAALAADPDIYQRGGILVRVIRDRMPSDGIKRSGGSAVIQRLPVANLRERMTRFVYFTKIGRHGDEVPAHPAAWLVNAIDARGEWTGIRVLMGVSDAPVLRPDGSVWQQPGYDAETGVLYEPSDCTFPEIHPDIRLDDAHAALELLEEVVRDFPFESDEHKAAWFSALLTPLARFAFAGPTPLFLIDANIRGAGKGLLVQTVGHIVLGREMPVSSYAHESEEMRKKLTAIAIAGDRMILFDNLEGLFGNDALDRALTSTRWKDRILGKSEQVDLPLMPTWFATGNNVQVAADTMRRIIHIRLDCLDEQPEERTGFTHKDLLAWVDSNRGRLLAAALTIVSAYLLKGSPAKELKPLGSFEGWSDVVRQAVVWVGLPDPCLTRIRLAESADTTGDAIYQLITAWAGYDQCGEGIVIADMVHCLYPTRRDEAPCDPASIAMRAALENVVACQPGKAPTARQIGNKLRSIRRRVTGGRMLDAGKGRNNQGKVWRLVCAGGES